MKTSRRRSLPNTMMMAMTDAIRCSKDQEWTARGERTEKEMLTMGERQSGVGRSHSALSEQALLPHIHIQMTSKVGWNGSCSTSLIIGLIIGLARFLINYSDLLEITIRASQCGWGGGGQGWYQ
jgi:hypothetical protein